MLRHARFLTTTQICLKQGMAEMSIIADCAKWTLSFQDKQGRLCRLCRK